MIRRIGLLIRRAFCLTPLTVLLWVSAEYVRTGVDLIPSELGGRLLILILLAVVGIGFFVLDLVVTV